MSTSTNPTWLVLANKDYETHMTDEGEQLQRGLEYAGWTLVGRGYADDCTHVPTLLDRYKPQIVFVQDFRDWTPGLGAFRQDVQFRNVEALAEASCVVTTVCKDAGTVVEQQKQFAQKINADAVVVYYHEKSVLPLSPWLAQYPLIRTYHSVDAPTCWEILSFQDESIQRKRGIVTGAANPKVYPLRLRLFNQQKFLDIDIQPHPGYGNKRCHTEDYLKLLSQYKLHLATASCYNFALRKIIESVAVCSVPVTDLPSYDTLPEIDFALTRIDPKIPFLDLGKLLTDLENSYSPEARLEFAKKAWDYYDWRSVGQRLSDRLLSVRKKNV